MAAPSQPILPPIEVEPGGRLSPVERGEPIFISTYDISGNTVVSEQTLHNIVSPYIGRDVRFTELSELKDKLTLAYVERGYVSSGAVIDPEALSQGLLSIRIVEGVMSDLRISNEGRLRDSYLRKRIQPTKNEIMNIVILEERLQVLQLDHRIRSLQTQLLPGEKRGQSILEVTVEETRPYSAMLEFSNYESPNVGAERVLLALEHNNITGYGDGIALDLRKSEGLTAWHVKYTVPVGRKGVAIFVDARDSDSEVVEDEFASLDIDSRASTYSIGIDYPLFRSARSRFGLSATLEKRHSESFLLGIPFSFTGGVEDGEADITVLRLGQTWNQRSRQRAIVVRSTLSIGLDAFDATTSSGNLPDGTFVKWLLQAQWAQRIPWLNSQIIAHGDVQLSNAALLGLEKYALGGHNSVRGYRENIFSADNGTFASLEWRVPLYSRGGGAQSVAVAPFLNYGSVWSDDDSIQSESLSSAGLGLFWNISRRSQVTIFWGHGFDGVGGGGDFQDDGLHLQARFEL